MAVKIKVSEHEIKLSSDLRSISGKPRIPNRINYVLYGMAKSRLPICLTPEQYQTECKKLADMFEI